MNAIKSHDERALYTLTKSVMCIQYRTGYIPPFNRYIGIISRDPFKFNVHSANMRRECAYWSDPYNLRVFDW